MAAVTGGDATAAGAAAREKQPTDSLRVWDVAISMHAHACMINRPLQGANEPEEPPNCWLMHIRGNPHSAPLKPRPAPPMLGGSLGLLSTP